MSGIPRTLRRTAARVLPRPLRVRAGRARRTVLLLRNYLYDFRRVATYSAAVRDIPSRENLRALITMDYHRIEKGLSLRDMRERFGADVLRRLERDIVAYERLYGRDETTAVALRALDQYCHVHEQRSCDVGEVRSMLDRIHAAAPGGAPVGCQAGGTIELERSQLLASIPERAGDLITTRHSVRDFDDRPVELDSIRTAVAAAMRSPSVCNRQSWRVHVYREPAMRERVLALQNGNAGFRHRVDTALVVTSPVHAFVTAGERNQCWIDGGMFSMSLILALHAQGLGACCLNWSVERERDQELHRAAGIPLDEAVIMMIAVGHLPERFLVAQSPRRPLEEVLRVDAPRSDDTLPEQEHS